MQLCIKEAIRKIIFLGLCPKQRIPPNHPTGLGLSRKLWKKYILRMVKYWIVFALKKFRTLDPHPSTVFYFFWWLSLLQIGTVVMQWLKWRHKKVSYNENTMRNAKVSWRQTFSKRIHICRKVLSIEGEWPGWCETANYYSHYPHCQQLLFTLSPLQTIVYIIPTGNNYSLHFLQCQQPQCPHQWPLTILLSPPVQITPHNQPSQAWLHN